MLLLFADGSCSAASGRGRRRLSRRLCRRTDFKRGRLSADSNGPERRPQTRHRQPRPPTAPAPFAGSAIRAASSWAARQLRGGRREANLCSATHRKVLPNRCFQTGARRQPPARRRVSAPNIFALFRSRRQCGAVRRATAPGRAAAAAGAPGRRASRVHNWRGCGYRWQLADRPRAGGFVPLRCQ